MYKNEKGFTLIEMLIVLTIITVLILLIVPNLTDKNKSVHDTGCEALKNTVQAQVGAYQLDKKKLPSDLEELETAKYITEDQTKCKNGNTLTLDEKGLVSINKGTNPDGQTN